MQITVSWVLLLLGLVHAQQSVYQQQFAAPQYGLRIQHENSQSNDPSDYNYSYDVRDEITGDRKSQEESRSGDSVRGRYSLVDADGSTRTVEYSVDAQSGFNAVVRRDGDQISVPNPNSRTISHHLNEYQSRRPSAPEVFRNRYQHERNRLDTRTRLAQDASTGNVVDLHSGFGVAPHVLSTPVPRSRENLDNLHNAQGRTNAYETHEFQRSEDVQEILARSHYQTSHPAVQHQSTHHVEQHQTSHPINHHLSTAPIHFPGSHRAFGSRANLAYERYSIRPATHEDVRRPSPIFADSNNANRAESRSNLNTNNQNIADYNNINAFNQHVQYPIQQEEIRGLITPAPVNPTFGPQLSSNENYPNVNSFNQHVQYPIQQEEIRGPTTPAPVNPTFRHQVAYHESNDSMTAYHAQPEFFGARINQNNRPTIQPIETGHVSVHEDSIITDSVATPAPFVTTVYPDTVVTPVPELYQDISRIPSSDRRNVEVTVNNVQSYLYPASTLPLNDNAPPHFFTGDDLAANNVSPLMNVHDFDVRSSLYNHLAASYFAEPIHHDAHLLK